jgi:hypothetical protein
MNQTKKSSDKQELCYGEKGAHPQFGDRSLDFDEGKKVYLKTLGGL